MVEYNPWQARTYCLPPPPPPPYHRVRHAQEAQAAAQVRLSCEASLVLVQAAAASSIRSSARSAPAQNQEIVHS